LFFLPPTYTYYFPNNKVGIFIDEKNRIYDHKSEVGMRYNRKVAAMNTFLAQQAEPIA